MSIRILGLFLLIGFLIFCSCALPQNNQLENDSTNSTISPEVDTTTLKEDDTTPLQEDDTTISEEIETKPIHPPAPGPVPELPDYFIGVTLEEFLATRSNIPLADLTPIKFPDEDYSGYHAKTHLRRFPNRFHPESYQLSALSEAKIPIEYIVQTDTDHVCAIYKIFNIANESIHYAYIFFEKIPGDQGIEWTMVGEIHYGENIEFSAFSDFKIGSSFSHAATIAPSLMLDFHDHYITSDDGIYHRHTSLMLKDGVLGLTFEAPMEERENLELLKCTDIRFYPYGKEGKGLRGDTISVLTATNRPPLPGEDD